MVFTINVVHHVLQAEWQNFSDEMARVLKPGGMAAIFEHNPVNPLTRKVVRNCEFDRDAVLLPHGKIIELFQKSELKIIDDAYIIFFPFKTVFRSVEKILGRIPLGAQQYILGEKLDKFPE
jgi:SAM-dependent methyltransferase